jgi:hypothetical protein
MPKKSEKGKKAKKRSARRGVVRLMFPIFFRSHLGTPKASGTPSMTPSGDGGQDAQGEPAGPLSPATPRAEALSILRGILLGEGDPNWAGFQVANPAMIKMRQGGPSLSGPGFEPRVDDGPGGNYQLDRSPGLGLRSEQAWRIWRGALEVMGRDKTLPVPAIFQAAITKAGVRMGQLDPAEARLIQMGIEWYLTDPRASASIPSYRE